MGKIINLIRKSNYVFIIGNGGSAACANHFANDLVKMCGIKAISLCANVSVLTAYANDNGYENIFSDQLKVFLKKDDLLITISGSGTSPNIINAIKLTKRIGAEVYNFPTMKEKKCSMQKIEDIHLQLAHEISENLINSITG